MVPGSLSQCFFTFLLFLSAALLKVWCRQSKLNRLFNLFSPCQESLSCEITEQEPRQRSPFKNSHREHPSALAPASAFALAASALSSWIQTWRQVVQSSLTLWRNCFTISRKAFTHKARSLLLTILKDVVTPMPQRPGHHYTTKTKIPGSLLSRTRGWKWWAVHFLTWQPSQSLFVCQRAREEWAHRLFVSWSSSFTSSQIDLLCFC